MPADRSAVEAMLRVLLNGLMAGPTGGAWARAFGDTALAAQRFVALGLEPPLTADASVQLDAVSIEVPRELAERWFWSGLIPPAPAGRGTVGITTYGAEELIPLFTARGVVPSPTQPGTPLVVADASGRPIGGITTSPDWLREEPRAAVLLADQLAALVAPRDISSFGPTIDLLELLNLPSGIGWGATPAREALLLAAHIEGYIGPDDASSRHRSPATPHRGIGRVSAVNEQRRRLYARALDVEHPFHQYLHFYHVIEHSYLDAHLGDITRALAAGHLGTAVTLWNGRHSEMDLLMSLMSQRIWSNPHALGHAYPTAGDPFYRDCGLKPVFAVTPTNATQSLPILIYRVRCGIVHTKADQGFLEDLPHVRGPLIRCLLPDVRWIAERLAGLA